MLHAERKKAAEAAFRSLAGDSALVPTGPEATMIVVAEAVDDSRSARRNLLWVGAGTLLTTGGTIFAILAGTPVIHP